MSQCAGAVLPKNLSNETGFSLIELMVVVAIISVLSTVAIPNYSAMAAKARQAEAKSELSAIYTAEKSAYAEGGVYTYCLYQAGYIPEGARVFYKSGYQGYSGCAACAKDLNSNLGCNIGAGIPWNGSTRNDGYFAMNSWANSSMNGQWVADNFEVTSTTFAAVAYGSISPVPIFDVWTMDENRNLKNNQPGF